MRNHFKLSLTVVVLSHAVSTRQAVQAVPEICITGTVDFILLEREVVIPSTTVQGQSVCVAAIAILGDYIVEENETFSIIVQTANSLDVVSPGRNTTTVTIVDDDGKH